MEEAYLQGYQAGLCRVGGWEGRLDMDLITLGRHGGEGRREQDGDTIFK